MESLQCPQTTGAAFGRRRGGRSNRESVCTSLKADLFSHRSVVLRQTASASRPLHSTPGASGRNSAEGFDSGREEEEGREEAGTEPRESPGGDKARGNPSELREEEPEQTAPEERPQTGNGIAPGLAFSSTGTDAGTPQPQGGNSLPPASAQYTRKQEAQAFPLRGRVNGTPTDVPLRIPPPMTSLPKARATSSVFSDVSDDEGGSTRAGSNGSWNSHPAKLGADYPWSSGGIPPPPQMKGASKAGLPKGMNLGLRGRQSVLGGVAMQGSRFEVGAGDTSWINSMSPDWFPVIPLWQATDKAAMASEPFLSHMSQGWRVILLSDGSVTRHLHLFTGHRVSVECLEMRPIGHSLLGVPPGTALVAGPRVQRQVLLKTKEGVPLIYAASWWAEYEAKQHLSESHSPIWTQLQEQRMELFRSLECLYYGHSRELEKLFGRDGPFWARHYLFYHNGRPLTLIYEVFSPALDEWLGDSALPEDLYLP